MSEPLDFSLSDLAAIKTEVDAGLGVLIQTLTVADKFVKFIPGNLGAEVETAISVLTELKSLLDKL